jgi:hypothetical protein
LQQWKLLCEPSIIIHQLAQIDFRQTWDMLSNALNDRSIVGDMGEPTFASFDQLRIATEDKPTYPKVLVGRLDVG